MDKIIQTIIHIAIGTSITPPPNSASRFSAASSSVNHRLPYPDKKPVVLYPTSIL